MELDAQLLARGRAALEPPPFNDWRCLSHEELAQRLDETLSVLEQLLKKFEAAGGASDVNPCREACDEEG